MECNRTDLEKKKGKYTHKACRDQSTSNKSCRDCCNCKHPSDDSKEVRKRVKCKDKCDKKFRKYAPEPSSQYELDSFEIGTESAICEDCGEIHGLDEYEEVVIRLPVGSTGCRRSKICTMPEEERVAPNICCPDGSKAAKKMKQAIKSGEQVSTGDGDLDGAIMQAQIRDSNKKAARRRASSKEDAPKRKKNKKKSFSFTSEPIPDYIMRALQPKKSVHPEYGKLRY